jgi:hypothetical protein
MNKKKTKTKTKINVESLIENPNQNPASVEEQAIAETDSSTSTLPDTSQSGEIAHDKLQKRMEADQQYQEEIKEGQKLLFEMWEKERYVPSDFDVKVPVDSLEAGVGYNSLIRLLHDSFTRMYAHSRSKEGGMLNPEHARE